MKLALLTAIVMMSASFVQAKDRYLVVFKSQQGQKAMETYFRAESAQPRARLQRSLRSTRSLVVKTKDAAFLNSLRNHPEVAVVEAEYFTPVPKPVNGFTPARMNHQMSAFVALSESTTNAGNVIPKFTQGDATPWGIMAINAGGAWDASSAGANARVLVLDTGIDAEHPAISPNFEQGKNFTEGSDGEVNEKDFADTEGHGTHTSGTILGAYNEVTGFTGVAPKAKLLMGRVCGTEGCSSIAIVEGINWGIEQKVDVINMSLGGPISSFAQNKAATDAEAAGVVIVAASGNSATEPTYSYDKSQPQCKSNNPFVPVMCGVGFPAALDTVVAVGALNAKLEKTNFSQWGPELDVTAPGAAVVSSVPRGSGRESKVELNIAGVVKTVKSSAFSGTELFTTPLSNTIVIVPGLGKPEDFAKVDVAGKFALVSRGEIFFSEKVKNAVAAKAAGVIIYNNTEGLMSGQVAEGELLKLPVVMIEQSEAAALISSMNAGAKATAAIATVASDYTAFDGTSMASPHVAGVVALMKSANKKLTPAQVRSILKATAKPLAPNDTNQYGAGVVQADRAVTAALAQ